MVFDRSSLSFYSWHRVHAIRRFLVPSRIHSMQCGSRHRDDLVRFYGTPRTMEKSNQDLFLSDQKKVLFFI